MYSLEIIKDLNKIKEMPNKWDSLIEKSGSLPLFLSYDWIINWLNEMGADVKPYVVIVKESEKITGILPLVIKKSVFINKLEFIGSSESDYLDFIIEKGKEKTVIQYVLNELQKDNTWDICELVNLREDSCNIEILEELLKTGGYASKKIKNWDAECPYLNIEGSWDDYLNKKKKKARYNLKREVRLLEELGNLEFKKITEIKEIERILPELFEIYNNRWKRYYTGSSLNDYKKRRFYRLLAVKYQQKNWLSLSVMKLNGKIVSFALSFIYKNKYYFYMPSYDVKYSKYSPGTIMVYYLLKEAHDNKIEVYDFMKGNETYKKRWANDFIRCFNISFANKCVKSRMLFRIYIFSMNVKQGLRKAVVARHILGNILNIINEIKTRYFSYVPPEAVWHISLKEKKAEKNTIREIYKYNKVLRYGREALLKYFDSVNINIGDEMLLPSYLCGSITHEIKKRGIVVEYYKIKDNFMVDIEDIKLKINHKKALLVIHYFGFPQNIESIKEICRNNNVLLIEDCAHSLFSKYNDRYLGTFGDSGIFSLRKTLPVYEGSILLENNKSVFKDEDSTVTRKYASVNKVSMFSMITKYFEYCTGISPRPIFLKNENMRRKYIMNNENIQIEDNRGISGFTQIILDKVDAVKVINKRRENYMFYLQNIIKTDKIIIPFNELPEGICPIGFPVLAENRNTIRKKLLNYGINLRTYWDYLPEDIKEDEFPVSHNLSKKIIILPVHQDLKFKHIQKVIEKINNEIFNC